MNQDTIDNAIAIGILLNERKSLEERITAINLSVRVLVDTNGTGTPLAAAPAQAGPVKRPRATTIGRAALRALTNAGEPVDAAGIAELVNVEGRATATEENVTAALVKLEVRGKVRRTPKTNPVRWAVGSATEKPAPKAAVKPGQSVGDFQKGAGKGAQTA